MAAVGHLAFDEQGRPFFILRDQEKQRQLTGIEALKVSIRPFDIQVNISSFTNLCTA